MEEKMVSSEEALKRSTSHCQKYETSLLNIIVKCHHEIYGFSFSGAVVVALREYADAVERNFDGKGYDQNPQSDHPVCSQSDIEKMNASNGCEVLVIAGNYDAWGKDHSSNAMPLCPILARVSNIS